MGEADTRLILAGVGRVHSLGLATNFLFWNTNRKDIADTVAAIATQRNVDVLILSECLIAPARLLVALNSSGDVPFHFAASLSDAAIVFTRFPADFMMAKLEDNRVSIRAMTLPGAVSLILAIISFPSKLYFSDDSQAQECVALADKIREVEDQEGHTLTLLVGDFNMNPFDKGMVGAVGLNATMARSIAIKGERKVQGKAYPFFYNPMWNLFGDDRDVAGTYFYHQTEHVAYFWHVFDQVLLRPALMHRLRSGDIEIVTTADGVNLLDREGRPDRKSASDHLPIFFRLNLQKNTRI